MKDCHISFWNIGFLLFPLFLAACTSFDKAKVGNNVTNKTQDSQQEEVECFDTSEFANAMKTATWIDSGDGFKYPDIMYKTEVFVDEIPTTMDIWTWGHIQLTLFCAGNWATFTEAFPVHGSIIVPHCQINEVTYTSENQCIFSGYLSDGRIFYLRRIIISDNVDVPSAIVLSLAYPKEFQKEVGSLIEIVRRWSISSQHN